MIYLYSGTPGSGKSLHMAKVIYTLLKKTECLVICNFMLNKDCFTEEELKRFIFLDNKKMSKSAGNFFTVRDISKKYDLQVIRFFMLEAHYRSPLNFSDQLVESAKSALERILNCVDMLRDQAQADENTRLTDADKANVEKIDGFVKNFENSMEDDFNTADAIAAIFDMVKLANITAKDGSREYAQYVLDKLTTLLGVLGIETEKKEELLDSDIEALIEERQQARKAKNFKRADEIRDELAAKGIILEDTRAGVKWKRA